MKALHASIDNMMARHAMDIHDCVDKWVAQEEMNMHSPSASPWGSRATSPNLQSQRRRNPECAVTTSWPDVPLRTDKSKSIRSGENYFDEHFPMPSRSFPPVPGALGQEDFQPESQPRLLGLEGAVKELDGEAVAAKASRESTTSKAGVEAWKLRSTGTKSFAESAVKDGGGGGLLGANGQVFFDVGALKAQLKENMKQSSHTPKDFYWETGWFRWVAKHVVFENLTLFVILINAVWMGYDADQNDETSLMQADIQFIVAENVFCVFFSFEWIVRFGAFKFKRNCLCDAWFVFDSVLLVMMIFETWVMPSVSAGGGAKALQGLRWMRLIRLTRLARVARLLRAVPQLLIMVKAIMISLKTVSYTFVLLILMVYIFGVAFTILTDGNDDEFDGVLISMNTLLLSGALPDQGDLVNRLRVENIGYYFLIVIYLMIASLTLMNMLIGILTEVISGVSTLEREEIQLRSVKERLWAMLTGLNLCTEMDDLITQEAFRSLLVSPQAAGILEEVDVDVVGLVDFADYIFSDEHPFLAFPDFMEVILQLRGSNTASVKDIVDLRKLVIKNGNDLKGLVRTLGHPNRAAFANSRGVTLV